MALYPKARKLLLPESRTQAGIRPTQFILHSIVAPWTVQRLYEYWQTTNLESHFGVDYSGAVGQYVDTARRADANASANVRAISVETASNTSATDPWNTAQMKALSELMAWAHKTHGIPLRKCRSSTDPGFGYHRMFSSWSVGGTSCPGNARVKQFDKLLSMAAGGAPPKPVDDNLKVVLAHLKYGAQDRCVKKVQLRLIAKKYSIPAGATGYYGGQTKAAVVKFQKARGWTGSDADGLVGPGTLAALGMVEY